MRTVDDIKYLLCSFGMSLGLVVLYMTLCFNIFKISSLELVIINK